MVSLTDTAGCSREWRSNLVALSGRSGLGCVVKPCNKPDRGRAGCGRAAEAVALASTSL